MPAPIRLAAGLLLATAFALCLASCEQVDPIPETLRDLVTETEPADIRILIIGIDGATYSVIDSLIAEGELPTFPRLMENGAWAPLRSDAPTLSAALWTNIATGKRRAEHGITDFRVRDPETGKPTRRLISSNERETLALWNLMGPFVKSTGFVGRWASSP